MRTRSPGHPWSGTRDSVYRLSPFDRVDVVGVSSRRLGGPRPEQQRAQWVRHDARGMRAQPRLHDRRRRRGGAYARVRHRRFGDDSSSSHRLPPTRARKEQPRPGASEFNWVASDDHSFVAKVALGRAPIAQRSRHTTRMRSSRRPVRRDRVRGEPVVRSPTKAIARRPTATSRGSACASSGPSNRRRRGKTAVVKPQADGGAGGRAGSSTWASRWPATISWRLKFRTAARCSRLQAGDLFAHQHQDLLAFPRTPFDLGFTSPRISRSPAGHSESAISTPRFWRRRSWSQTN